MSTVSGDLIKGSRGIARFYYGRQLPARAVAIARISTPPMTPAELTSLNNFPYRSGSLSVQVNPGGTTFTASFLDQAVTISGSTMYQVTNQFFEITDQADTDGVPLFYSHPLGLGVSDVTVLDLEDQVQTGFVVRQVVREGKKTQCVFHDFKNPTLKVHYIDASGFTRTELLRHNPVLRESPVTATSSTYTRAGIILTVANTSPYYVRFRQANGYQLLAPYGDLPNNPWFARVRFGLTPPPLEWASQTFIPKRPYILATWATGAVLGKDLIQFERQPIFFDGIHYPDVLVYDKNYVLKHALAGSARRGYLFPWKLSQFRDIDPEAGVVQVTVELDPTDIVFGFYSYREPDVVYRDLDLNPFTNPEVCNRLVRFIYNPDGPTPFRTIYHQILNTDGTVYKPDPELLDPMQGGNPMIFAEVGVGTAVGPQRFIVEDARERGGGLSPAFQNIPEAMNFWDLGYWDGKPFPIGGGLVIFLPTSLLQRFSQAEIRSRIEAIIPMGTLPVIRYYSPIGEESV